MGLLYIFTLQQGPISFPKIQQPPTNSRRQKSDMKRVAYRRPTVTVWHVNPTVTWRFLLGTCELTFLYVGENHLS
jgi:hypothetical protein